MQAKDDGCGLIMDTHIIQVQAIIHTRCVNKIRLTWDG